MPCLPPWRTMLASNPARRMKRYQFRAAAPPRLLPSSFRHVPVSHIDLCGGDVVAADDDEGIPINRQVDHGVPEVLSAFSFALRDGPRDGGNKGPFLSHSTSACGMGHNNETCEIPPRTNEQSPGTDGSLVGKGAPEVSCGMLPDNNCPQCRASAEASHLECRACGFVCCDLCGRCFACDPCGC